MHFCMHVPLARTKEKERGSLATDTTGTPQEAGLVSVLVFFVTSTKDTVGGRLAHMDWTKKKLESAVALMCAQQVHIMLHSGRLLCQVVTSAGQELRRQQPPAKICHQHLSHTHQHPRININIQSTGTNHVMAYLPPQPIRIPRVGNKRN